MDNNIIIFKTEDEQIKVDVRFYDDSVWLTIDQMAALFERDKSTISRHIKNVYSDKEWVTLNGGWICTGIGAEAYVK